MMVVACSAVFAVGGDASSSMEGTRMMRIVARFALLCLFAFGASQRAVAVDGSDFYDYRVLLDTDVNVATGCDVEVHDLFVATTVHGFEQIVTIHVSREVGVTQPKVIGIERQVCVSGSTFGPEIAVSPGVWNVGMENGVFGSDVVEGFVPRAALGNPTTVRMIVVAERVTSPCSDVILTTDRSVDGPPILLTLGPAIAAPMLTRGGMVLIAVFLGVVALWSLRRAPIARLMVIALMAVCVAAAAFALSIVMDGGVSDWGGSSPLAIDDVGDSSAHDVSEDMLAFFATTDAFNLYFRVDVLDLDGGVGQSCAVGGDVCNGQLPCGDLECFTVQTTEGTCFCHMGVFCDAVATCTTSADCATGSVCAASCCDGLRCLPICGGNMLTAPGTGKRSNKQ